MRLRVHSISGIRRTQMGEAGPGQKNPRGVRMIDGRQNTAAIQGVGEIDVFAASRRPLDPRTQRILLAQFS